MRRLWVVAVLAVAVVIAMLLASTSTQRGAADRDPARSARRQEPANSESSELDATPGAARTDRAAGASRRKRASRRIRLLYTDGEPAAGIPVHCASGRKLATKVFRNGDYPEKTIWMITDESSAVTDADGWFLLHPPPTAIDAIFYTDPDAPAVLLAAWDAALTEYRASRRAEVTGTLRGSDGKARTSVWISAQLGRPEGYDTRTHHEVPAFVGARGGLDIDPTCKFEAETGRDGQFTLLLAPGPNTLCFDEGGGSIPIVVPSGGALDLGNVTPPPKSAIQTSSSPRELHGTVRSLSGAPVPGAVVRLWDGNVGEASHEVDADKNGAWRVTGLHGHRVIAWALSASRRHMVLPAQSSGTIAMPCSSPVSLVAPGRNEYAWVRARDVDGFFLFVRAGIFLGGEPLDSSDTIGLPLGEYRIFAVTDEGVLELATVLGKSGPQTLAGFR